MASSDAAFTQRHAEPSSSFIYEHHETELMAENSEQINGGGADISVPPLGLVTAFIFPGPVPHRTA